MVATQIVILIVLVAMSAFFSGSETALTSLTKGRVHALLKNKRKGSYFVDKLKSNSNRLLTTILIGNNIVNISASVIATLLFTELYGSKGPLIAAITMTVVILFCGEILPKTLAIRLSEKFALLLAPILWLIQMMLFPLVYLVENIAKLPSLVLGTKEKSITEEELIALAGIGAEEGTIQHQEKELIENVLEFNDTEVKDIMTPRMEIDALEDETLIKDAVHFINEGAHNKLPVYHENIDNIIGLITVRDILEHIANGDFEVPLKKIKLRTPFIIPTTKNISVLLREMQKKRINMAIVIDEHGGTAGLISIEDILEEIVGEIVDEHEEEEAMVRMIDKNTIIVQGKTPIFEVNDSFKTEILMEDYKPVSSLILKKLRRIPKQGEKFMIDNLQFRIEKMARNKIETVRIEKINSKKP